MPQIEAFKQLRTFNLLLPCACVLDLEGSTGKTRYTVALRMVTPNINFRVKLSSVLVATDFSAASETAVLYATAIARRHRSKLFLVHVVTSRSEGALMDGWRAGQQEITKQLLADHLDGIEHELIVRSGNLWEVLSFLVEDKSADLLVIGTRGRTGVRKLILGSVAETIFRQAPCPVLTVGPNITGQDPELNPVRVSFSRDGKFVAYYLQDVRGGQLWRARADGTDKLQLTPQPMRLYMAQYSPDNKRIAFMARWPQQPWKIYWVASEGGAIHEIPSKVLNEADPNWSPDGQSILFGQPPNTFAEPGAIRALYLYDFRTNKTSEIPNSKGLFSPRWSPDGRYVVAMTLDFNALELLNLQSGERHTLIQHDVNNPFWSKDSDWVYFNGEELYRVRLTDSHLERVPIRSSAISQYSRVSANGFAPDGSILLSCIDARRDVYAMEWK